MTFYSEMATVVTELIGEFGADVLVSRSSGTTTNPVTGNTTGTSVSANFTVKGILKKYPDSMIDGTRIKSSDRMLMIETSGGEIRTSDRLTMNDQLWPIMEINTVEPAGTALIYFIRVRK